MRWPSRSRRPSTRPSSVAPPSRTPRPIAGAGRPPACSRRSTSSTRASEARKTRRSPIVGLIDRLPKLRLRRQLGVALALVALLAVAAPVSAGPKTGPLGTFKHLVVIYEENHSFDNLYGNWGEVNGTPVIGRSDATAGHTLQV